MTAVMRALRADDGPRIPRIAVLVNGRIVEERLFKQGNAVTVGAGEASSFVVAAPFARHTLFERTNEGWRLHLAKGMTARVATPAGIVDVDAGEGRSLALMDRGRGKVVLGSTTFLFELVAAPPPQPRPELPLGVKNALANQVDYRLAIIAALSFLFHFGIVGAMYSDWMDPTIGPDREVVGLIDDLRKLPTPPPETPPSPTTPDDAREAKNDPTPSPSPKPGPVKTDTKAPGPPSHSKSDTSMSDSHAAAIAREADALELSLVAATNGGTAVDGALKRTSEIPMVDLGAAAASQAAAKRGDGSLKIGSGGVPVQKGGDNGLGKLAQTKRDGTDDAGRAGKDPAPPAIVDVGPKTTNVPVSDADRVIANLRGRFRKCYETGLNGDPTMQGKVVVAAKIQPNGEVQSASVQSNEGLSPGVAACIAGVVKGAQFTGNGAMTTLNVPVTFRHQ